jgi:hypothetical protein
VRVLLQVRRSLARETVRRSFGHFALLERRRRGGKGQLTQASRLATRGYSEFK